MTLDEYKKKYSNNPNAVVLQQIIANYYMERLKLKDSEWCWIKQHIKDNNEEYKRQIEEIENK